MLGYTTVAVIGFNSACKQQQQQQHTVMIIVGLHSTLLFEGINVLICKLSLEVMGKCER